MEFRTMQNETKVSLVVGLLIIVGFGVVLNQVKGPPVASALQPTETAGGGTFTSRALEPRADDVRPEDHPRRSRRTAPPVRYASRRPPPVPRATPGQAAARTYTVQPNDSLARIARRVYGSGDPKYYKLIYEANRDKMPNIATIRTGQVLKIPAPPDGAPVLSARFGAGRSRGSVAVRGGGTR